ncbi:LysR family transcriptional regulator [Jannaschia sp. M317]|uniref:LysR family transcriptional regulator n=1 Tax=Jannaschia sp. M317 TaxID=2867011 RepID=UPI0021A2AA6D|nr:LysR family transcriptional regulator [Jannaschia sp. M317]UWQ18703.1 LysR family transcriptional regulator [Jannaschia sp. M317]
MFDWSDIRTFLAVLRDGSAASAARRLGTNQTTVSRRLARLEDALGLKLFDPGPRGARPTEAARRLLPEAEAMEAAALSLSSRADGMSRRLTGTIRLTANPNAMRYAGGIIRNFQRAHPGAEFRIDTETRTLSLEDGEADIALRPGVRLSGDTLIARKLLDHPWGFYASDGYLAQHGTPRSFTDLADHDLVCCTGNAAQVEPIPTAQARLPRHDHRIHIESLNGVIGLLRAGEGVGFLPRAEGDIEPGLSFCFSEPDLVQGLWLVTSPEGHADPLIRAFMRFCADAIPDLLASVPPEWRV